MPTVCFCNTNPAWGGGEKWHLEAAASLVDRGWKTYLVCAEKSPLHFNALQQKGLHILPIKAGRLAFLNPLLRRNLTRFFVDHHIKNIILNLSSDLKLFGLAAKSAKVPTIIYRRGSDIPVKDTMVNRYLYRHVLTKVIANSEATKKAVLSQNGNLLPEKKITVLPNGIDPYFFDLQLEQAHPFPCLTKKAGIVIGNAGRLNKQKAQHFLLYLAKELMARQVSFTIIIAGAGEREHKLKELAKNIGVEKHVYFTGFLDDLSPFWKSIDIFFLSSLWEGFGFVLAEAMLAKKAIFAFNVSNIPELVFPEKNGYLFPLPKANDLSALADAIIDLQNNAQKLHQMGQAGRQLILEKYSQTTAMNNLEALLQKK